MTGIIVAGYGGGALVFDQVSTLFVNPANISPQETDDDDGIDVSLIHSQSLSIIYLNINKHRVRYII